MRYLLEFKSYEDQLNERFFNLNDFNIPEKIDEEVINSIKRSRKLSQELKDFALSHLKWYSKYDNGIVTELKLHTNLKKKIKEKELPSGFSMGVDENGYFIHTHRARSKSFKKPESITIKCIKFIDGTG